MITMRLHKASHRRASLAGSKVPRSEPVSRFTNALPGMSLVAMCLALVALVAVACVPAMAQVIYGGIVGTVTDASGATVPGAAVKITSLGTNESRTATTSSAGAYSFPSLTAGQYRLEVQQAGFKQFIRTSVDVQVDVTSRVDVSLQIGSFSESIEVTSEAPLLQTDTSSLGAVVPQQEIQSIPLSGRNINNLLALVPGVVAQGGTYGNAVGNQLNNSRTNAIGFGNYAIGGGFGNQSQFYVDGVASNAPANNLTTYIPSQDVVQEFRVVTNNVSAEYGSYAGGVINLTSKSGSNKFHGSAYEYLRNKALNANNFFSNRIGLPRPPLVQNQYGGTLGGPVRKDKTFFFFGLERQLFHTGNLIQTTVPTAAMRAGDFSAPGLAPIYDQSQPGNPQFQCNGVLNVICPNRLNSVAVALFNKEYPLPNGPGLFNNFNVNQATGGVNMQYNARVDHRFSDNNTMFVRYGQWKAQSFPFDAWGLGTQGQGASGIYTKQAVLGDTYTFTSTTVFDIRLSLLRVFEHEFPLSSGVDLSQFGSNYTNAVKQQPNPANWPTIGFAGTAGVSSVSGSSPVGSQLYWRQNLYAINANLTKIAGRHQVKFGFSAKRTKWLDGAQGGSIGLNFGTDPTSLSNGVGGSSVASALLGIPSSTSMGVLGASTAFFTSYGFFAEDTVQATKKLTLTLGLRWDQPGIYSEVNDSDTVFLPNQANPLGSFLNPVTGQTQTLKGNFAVVNTPQWQSRREDYLHWKQFSPRVGFAYRLTEKTVLRAAYGISYPPGTLSQDGPHMSSVNGATTTVTNTFKVQTGSPDSILATVANPIPYALTQPPRHAATPDFFYGKSLFARKPGDPVAYVQQWNVALEQQLGKDARLSVAYAGSKGSNLLMAGAFTFASRGLDQLPNDQFSRGLGLLAMVANPFYGKITTPGLALSQPLIQAGQLLRPFPQYGNVAALDPHVGRSDYRSLQTSFMKRLGNSGILTVAYTYSRLMSNTDSVTSFLDEYGGVGGLLQDNNNLDSEYSLAGFDVPHNLAIGYGIDLPFGKGKRFLNGVTGIGNGILSGWRVNGITTIRSGNPLSITQMRFGTPLATFGGGFAFVPFFQRPDKVANCNMSVSGSREYRVDHGWFNTACFTDVGFADVRFGNAPRYDGSVRTDNMDNWDFSVAKDTHIRESLVLRFTAEFYNTFNHPRFGSPNGAIDTPVTALVTSQSNQPRAIQFGLRLDF